MARVDKLEILLETDGEGRVHATLGETARRVEQVGAAAEKSSNEVRLLKGAFALLGGAIGGLGLVEVIRHTVATNVEFERQRAVLTTLEGSQHAANMRMRELQQIASETPSQLQDVIQAYATLKARGLDPSREALLAYANVAAASGKSTQQFIEAVADAATGEMERLKEFGIIARQQGDEVAFTFQGATTVVKRSADEIEQYLQNIGRVEFAGAAAEQMKTLGGAASNLMDNVDRLIIALGDSGLRSALTAIVTDLSQTAAAAVDFVENSDAVERSLQVLAATAGAAGAVMTARLVGPLAATAAQFTLTTAAATANGVALLAASVRANTFSASMVLAGARSAAAAGSIRLASGALALIGGPAGAAVLAAAGLAYLASVQTTTETAAEALAEALGRLDKATDESLAGAIAMAQAERDRAAATLAAARAELERQRVYAEGAKGQRGEIADLGVQSRLADIRALEQQLDKADQQLAQAHDRYRGWVDAVNAGPPALDAAAGSTEGLSSATAKLLERLRDQVATMGKSRAAILEHQKAQALAGVTSEEARAEIARLYDQMIAFAKAEDAAAEAAKRRTQQRKDSTREDAAARRELQAQVSLVQQLVEEFSPLVRMEREYAEAEAAFEAAIASGNATVEQRNQVLGRLRQEILETAAAQSQAQALIAAPEMGEASRQMWLEIGKAWADGAGDALTDALLTGDWESVGKQWMEMLFGDSLRATLEEQLVTPLRAALDNGSGIGAGFRQIFSGRAYENDPNFVGPPSTMQGSGEPGAGAGANWGAIIGGVGAAYGGYQAARQGNMAGTVMNYAATGAAIGGPWGAAIGAVVGVIVGLLAKPKPPDLRIGGEGVTRKPEHNFSTVFGDMQVGSRAGVDSMEWARAVEDFDRRMRDIFRAADYTGEQFDAIRGAMARWSIDVQGMDNITADAVLGSRFDAMMRAVEPQWAGFLANIDDLEDRVTALGALWDIEGQVESLGLAIDDLSASPLERLRTQLAALDDSVGSTADALAAAIEEQDAARIRDTAAAAQQAVMDRLTREIELVRSLQAAIEEAEASARALELSLAQRIQAAGGGVGLVAGTAQQQAALYRDNVTGTADPARALEWLDQFIGAVDTWLQASIADVQELADEQQRVAQAGIDAIDAQLQAIEAAQQLARTMEAEATAALNRQLGLAQRIAELGGQRGDVTAQAAAAMAAQRAAVTLASDAGTALERLDQFIGAVDAWLQSAVADVQAIADAQTRAAEAEMQAIDARLTAIASERDAIMSGASERAAAERALQQAAEQAQEAARRAQLDALQQQLQLAQQWLGVLNSADDLLQQLTVGTANPLGGFGRLDILSTQIAEREAALASAGGADRARIASELLDLLNQRIGLVQQEGLFDRPSGDYLGIYNDTLRRIGDVRAIAAPGADSVEDLQRRIADLQAETTAAVDRLTDTTLQLTADERARLDALAAEEAALQDRRAALEQQLLDIQTQAQADIAALQATAREQLEWARTVSAELEATRHAELLEQLAAITGGRPLDAFVAQAADLHAQRMALEQQLLDIQTQAQADIAALQAAALEQYEWARTVGAELEATRHAELLEQLAAITGGQDIDAWIADRTALAADLLTQIRDDLRAWMASISAGGNVGDGTLPGVPGVPGVPGGPGYGDMPPPFLEPPGNVAPRSINAEFNITVHATGDGADIGRQVSAEIDRQLPQLASKLRRELAVA